MSDTDVAEAKKMVRSYGYQECWTTSELEEAFTVTSFCMGVCFATRKSDGAKGCLSFTSSYPRIYFDFRA